MSGAIRRTGACIALVALVGCAGAPPQPEEVSTGLSRLTGPEAPAPEGPSTIPDDKPEPGSLAAAAAHNAALDLLAWQDQRDRAATPRMDGAAARGAPPPTTPPSSESTASAAEPGPALGPPDPAPAPDGLEEQIKDAVSRLEDLLRQRLSPGQASGWIELAALSPLSPVLADRLKDSQDLSPAERATVEMFGSLAGKLGESGVAGDPGRVADALQAAMDAIAGSMPLRIRAAELCTRVDGFGQYRPVEGNIFEAMRPHRVIVYTEVENFAYRPVGEAELGSARVGQGDRWAVSLTQQLELYNETGAMSAWSRPAAPVVETSRNKRRDFHIVDQIDLPPNLSIGVYHLKITVKDRATGAQDTRSIELRIVADPTLARGERSR